MTRKKAIEIVVANAKMGWPPKGWQIVFVTKDQLFFRCYRPKYPTPKKCDYRYTDWAIPRAWLEEKGYL